MDRVKFVGLWYLQYGEIGLWVVVDELCGLCVVVIEDDCDVFIGGCIGNDVVVG